MIGSTLMANGAKVYIVDIDPERLERFVLILIPCCLYLKNGRIPKLYNQNAASHMGSLVGVQADISKKVWFLDACRRSMVMTS